ncbi:MAG: hypothetical protein OXG58_02000 [Gemmatimonadetes bacterium]|nr:hypothetical protein [Gemmatimonadota bacterium]MCY3943611.1 hypothetical protein [Gemmatimonadota bacterium]
MLIVNRHTTRDDGPFLATLRIQPTARSQLTDVRGRLLEEFGDDFARFARSFYISDHTTAGYLDQRMAELLEHDRSGINDYLELFRELFPPGADYVHDTMELRSELTEEQRASEPLNADSHLTFIGAGLRNSASYELKGGEPVWFVELDGVHLGGTRQRRTTVLAYDREEEVERCRIRIPASPHAIDAQNLRDPRVGFIGALERMVDGHRVAFGRFDVSLPDGEENAGLTVNEYEPLLMDYDLRNALRNPFRFMAQTGKDVRHALRDPRSIPAKAMNFAQFDAVQVLNQVLDRVRLRNSVVERVVNRAVALPVSHFLRMKRAVSLPVLDRGGDGTGDIGWGTYQSPILVQWRGAPRQSRELEVTLLRFV